MPLVQSQQKVVNNAKYTVKMLDKTRFWVYTISHNRRNIVKCAIKFISKGDILMKFKRLLAFVMSALMVASCMSFASAEELSAEEADFENA